MTDKASFAGFVSSGAFSGPDAPSIPRDQDALVAGFRTFLLSKAMPANIWFAVVTPGLSEDDGDNGFTGSVPASDCTPLNSKSTKC